MMEENDIICVQTTPEMRGALESIAAEKNQSVSSVVESIIGNYLKDHQDVKDSTTSRRRFERKSARLPAFIGDSRWQRRDFEQSTILDISLLGIRLSVPKGTTLEIPKEDKTTEFCIIFNLPDYHWPIRISCLPKWTVETDEDIQMGVELVNHDAYAFKALQKYVI